MTVNETILGIFQAFSPLSENELCQRMAQMSFAGRKLTDKEIVDAADKLVSDTNALYIKDVGRTFSLRAF